MAETVEVGKAYETTAGKKMVVNSWDPVLTPNAVHFSGSFGGGNPVLEYFDFPQNRPSLDAKGRLIVNEKPYLTVDLLQDATRFRWIARATYHKHKLQLAGVLR